MWSYLAEHMTETLAFLAGVVVVGAVAAGGVALAVRLGAWRDLSIDGMSR
jgi:hypothetical protein